MQIFFVADVSISSVIDGEVKVKGSDAQRRKTGRLSDIGTGCGFFLTDAQKRGWKVKGIDPSIELVEVAKRQCGLGVFNCSIFSSYYQEDLFGHFS